MFDFITEEHKMMQQAARITSYNVCYTKLLRNNVLFNDQGQVVTQGGVDQRYKAWFQEEGTTAVQEAKSQILGGTTTQLLQKAQNALV